MQIQDGDAGALKKKFFLLGLPKTELHVHLEGTLEPTMVLHLVHKNCISDFPLTSISLLHQRMGDAHDLSSFIEVYEQILFVIRTEDDFYEVAMSYLRRVREQGVVYVEMFFDPQMHTCRGIPFDTIISGLRRAHHAATHLLSPMRCFYIMCFNRDRPLSSHLSHLELALPHRDIILGIGADNPEHPGFAHDLLPAYTRAAREGLRLTSHCDVDTDGTLQSIRECIDLLNVSRIDHGVSIVDDPPLLSHALTKQIAFTVCPTLLHTPTPGAVAMRYFVRCVRGAVRMAAAGLRVTLASDDPGILCGQYVGDVYVNVWMLGGVSIREMVAFARNGFEMAWLEETERERYLSLFDSYTEQHKDVNR